MNLREIAKRANVSVAPVSRTINCAPNLDPSLARRVRKVIEQVGYYPNTHARALVSGRSPLCIVGASSRFHIGPNTADWCISRTELRDPPVLAIKVSLKIP